MKRQYDKLVRDRIPEIISANGHACAVETLDEAAYAAALLAKLVEEAHELRDAPAAERVSELADVLEVVDALVAKLGLGTAEVRAVQTERRNERGGFALRLRLLWIDDGR